jgi:ribosomal silencing factor RsfS
MRSMSYRLISLDARRIRYTDTDEQKASWVMLNKVTVIVHVVRSQ